MLKQILSATKVVLLALALSFGLSYALAWTAPTATPPGANVAAPINAGDTNQIKTGGLTAGSFTTAGAVTAGSVSTTGLTNTGTLRVTTGAGATKVLTSDASGNATWQTPAVGSGDNLGNHTATQALNMAGFGINSAGTTNVGRLNVSEAAGAYSYVTMADNESPNGIKYIHANSNVVGFLSGAGSWLSYWTNAGDQYNTRNVYANDVYAGGRWMSSLSSGSNVYSCPVVGNCGNDSCKGNLSLNSTCTRYTYNTDSRTSCATANVVACTLVGKIVP